MHRLHRDNQVVQHEVHVEWKTADFFRGEMQRYAWRDFVTVIGREKFDLPVIRNLAPSEHGGGGNDEQDYKRRIKKESVRVAHVGSAYPQRE